MPSIPIGPTIWGDPLFADGFDRLEPSNRLYSAPLGKNFRMNVVALSVDYRFAKCQFCGTSHLHRCSCEIPNAFEASPLPAKACLSFPFEGMAGRGIG